MRVKMSAKTILIVPDSQHNGELVKNITDRDIRVIFYIDTVDLIDDMMHCCIMNRIFLGKTKTVSIL